KLDLLLQKRRHIAQLYNDYLSDIPGIIRPAQLDGVESGWHLYMIQMKTNIVKKSRKEIFNDMRKAHIGVHVHYIPVYWHPYYEKLGYTRGLCPVAESWYEQALTLPIHPGMTEEDVKYVVDKLGQVIG